MSFRRKGKAEHQAHRQWEAWKRANAELFARSGLPPDTFRTQRDWNYLVRYGYWCKGAYGEHINKIDFSLDELTPEQLAAFEQLQSQTSSAQRSGG
jgi:hypothetical protein